MSIKAMTWAWQLPLSSNQKIVLLALADHADDNGKCWPGIEGLAEKCGLSRSSIIEHLKVLEAINVLHKQKIYDEYGKRRANLYVLNLALSPELLHSELLRPDLLRSKTLRSKYRRLSPDFDAHYVQNLDGNNINIIKHQKATVIESSSIAQAQDDAQFLDAQVSKNAQKQKDAQMLKEAFQVFWQAYPKRKDKTRAFKSFAKIKPSSDLLNQILQAIENQNTERIYQQRYTGWCAEWKNPATWLNGENWNDEVNLNEEYWQNEANKRKPHIESLTERSQREREERRGKVKTNCFIDDIPPDTKLLE